MLLSKQLLEFSLSMTDSKSFSEPLIENKFLTFVRLTILYNYINKIFKRNFNCNYFITRQGVVLWNL